MYGDGSLTPIEAYKRTVDGFRSTGLQDLGLDEEAKGINALFESETEKWEVLIQFFDENKYEVRSRSVWKLSDNNMIQAEQLVELVDKRDQGFDFKLNNKGAFEVKSVNQIPNKDGFMELMRTSIIDNIGAYESYSRMLRQLHQPQEDATVMIN